MKDRQLKVPASSSYFNSPAWYLRERVPVQTVADRRTKKYFELEEQTNVDGFVGEVLIEKDYPITPEYVSSFAASSDYRSDPLGAISSAPERRNLGDITQMQKALGLDFETARRLVSEIRAAQQRKVNAQDVPATEVPVTAGKEGE